MPSSHPRGGSSPVLSPPVLELALDHQSPHRSDHAVLHRDELAYLRVDCRLELATREGWRELAQKVLACGHRRERCAEGVLEPKVVVRLEVLLVRLARDRTRLRDTVFRQALKDRVLGEG